MHRNPSHLGPKLRPPCLSGSGIPFTDLASIGRTGGITGRSTCVSVRPGARRRRRAGGHTRWWSGVPFCMPLRGTSYELVVVGPALYDPARDVATARAPAPPV